MYKQKEQSEEEGEALDLDEETLRVVGFIETNDFAWMIAQFFDHETVKIYEFEETEPLSSYLYTFNAGPF